jgi:hypothetical protein
VWGYGVRPQSTPKVYFNEAGKLEDYLELCRFFVINDKVPEHTASKFLAITHRILKKHTKIKWLFTYAAGFQGLIGTIYKASGYEYFGKKECKLFYIPEQKCLIHPTSIYHRYKINFALGNIPAVKKIFPTAKIWHGWNFIYIYIGFAAKRKKKI